MALGLLVAASRACCWSVGLSAVGVSGLTRAIRVSRGLAAIAVLLSSRVSGWSGFGASIRVVGR